MFKLRSIYRGLNIVLPAKSSPRTFLSEAFQCSEAWKSRLTTPILQKINVDNLYYELEQRFQQKNKASAVDIDLYANKLDDESHLEEAVDLLHKLRMTDETSNTLESTSHAIIRNHIDHNQITSLLQILNNRLNYGLFLDNYTANLLLDKLIKANDFKSAARVSTLLMLQEQYDDEITRALSIYACYRFSTNIENFADLADDAAIDDQKDGAPQSKKKKEEIKVRVKYLRNSFFDDHFDIVNTSHLVGKTISMLAKGNYDYSDSLQLLGLTLSAKYDEAKDLIGKKQIVIYKDVVDIINEKLSKIETITESDTEPIANLKLSIENLEKTVNLNTESLESILIKAVTEIITQNEKHQIEEQKKVTLIHNNMNI